MSIRRYDANRFKRTYSWFSAVGDRNKFRKSYSFFRQKPVPVLEFDGMPLLDQVLLDEQFTSDTGQFTQLSIHGSGSFALSSGAGVFTTLLGAHNDRFIKVTGMPQLTQPLVWIQADFLTVTGNPNNFNIGQVGFLKDGSNYLFGDYDAKNQRTRVNYLFNGTVLGPGQVLFQQNGGNGPQPLSTPFRIALSVHNNQLITLYDDSMSGDWQVGYSHEIPLSSIDLRTFDFSGWFPSLGASSSDNATCTWTIDNLRAYQVAE